MTRWLLNLAYLASLGALSPWLAWRALRTGRYRTGWRGRLWGTRRLPGPTPKGPVVWLHGVSVGEVHLLGPLARVLAIARPDVTLVISSTTDTGVAEALKRFPGVAVVRFPVDLSWAVARTIDAVRPALVLLAEGDLWPNFLAEAGRRGVPVAVVNGRMSPKSAGRYARFARLLGPLLLERVALFAAQSEEYAEGYRRAGVPADRVAVTGSLKWDGAGGDRGAPAVRAVAAWLNAAPGEVVWVAGSTHAPEERICLETFARLRATHPGLRLVLVPRAPDRFDEVASLVRAAGLEVARRTAGGAVPAGAVALVDTMGELAAVWGVADVGFVGGTFHPTRGGQSVIEPAGLGVPLAVGPNHWNFRDPVLGLAGAGGLGVVRTQDELTGILAGWLADPTARARAGAAAADFARLQQGATARTAALVLALLPPPAP